MTHSHKRGNWKNEFLYTSTCGFLYGGTVTLVGHPFDTVKTKMQTQIEHMNSANQKIGYLETIRNVSKNEGLTGFRNGWMQFFSGSVVYRSVQFSVFEACYTYLAENERMCQPIPYLYGGLEWRTLLSAFAGGSLRSIIECPFEYVKVKRQTNQSYKFNKMFLGI